MFNNDEMFSFLSCTVYLGCRILPPSYIEMRREYSKQSRLTEFAQSIQPRCVVGEVVYVVIVRFT